MAVFFSIVVLVEIVCSQRVVAIRLNIVKYYGESTWSLLIPAWYLNIKSVTSSRTLILFMKRSNLFAHIELSKFVIGLKLDPEECRSSLISQHAYFSLIPSRMFSDQLAPEWEEIFAAVSKSGPVRDEDGRIVASAVKNTIRQMSREECVEIVKRVMRLQQQVAAEF